MAQIPPFGELASEDTRAGLLLCTLFLVFASFMVHALALSSACHLCER